MQNTLRKIVLASIALAAVALASKPAMAAATLNVPFSFTVAGKVCPAGYYSVERSGFGNHVTLRSHDGSKSFSWITGPGDPGPTATEVKLRFAALGQQHALHTVQYGNTITSKLDKMNTRQIESISAQMDRGR